MVLIHPRDHRSDAIGILLFTADLSVTLTLRCVISRLLGLDKEFVLALLFVKARLEFFLGGRLMAKEKKKIRHVAYATIYMNI